MLLVRATRLQRPIQNLAIKFKVTLGEGRLFPAMSAAPVLSGSPSTLVAALNAAPKQLSTATNATGVAGVAFETHPEFAERPAALVDGSLCGMGGTERALVSYSRILPSIEFQGISAAAEEPYQLASCPRPIDSLFAVPPFYSASTGTVVLLPVSVHTVDVFGNALPNQPISWSSTDPESVFAVESDPALLTAQLSTSAQGVTTSTLGEARARYGLGEATEAPIIFTSGSRSGSASVTGRADLRSLSIVRTGRHPFFTGIGDTGVEGPAEFVVSGRAAPPDRCGRRLGDPQQRGHGLRGDERTGQRARVGFRERHHPDLCCASGFAVQPIHRDRDGHEL